MQWIMSKPRKRAKLLVCGYREPGILKLKRHLHRVDASVQIENRITVEAQFVSESISYAYLKKQKKHRDSILNTLFVVLK